MNGPIKIEEFRRSETSQTHHAAVQRIVGTMAALWSQLRQGRRMRRTKQTLQALDDQMLRDIGISRTAIEWVALHDAARELVRTRALASCRRELDPAAPAAGGDKHPPSQSANPMSLTLSRSRARERGVERVG
jgi:uncharacterized protein YjiS (DUF1127 family)